MATETTSSQFNPLKYWLITWSFFRRYPVFPGVILIVLVIAAIIGFFAAILLGLWGILYYPIKRALKRRKDKKMLLKNSKDES